MRQLPPQLHAPLMTSRSADVTDRKQCGATHALPPGHRKLARACLYEYRGRRLTIADETTSMHASRVLLAFDVILRIVTAHIHVFLKFFVDINYARAVHLAG